MSDPISVLLPFAISAAVAVVLGLLLQRRAPRARWVYLGIFLATLAIVRSYDLWFRVIAVAVGAGLTMWDYRRSRKLARE